MYSVHLSQSPEECQVLGIMQGASLITSASVQAPPVFALCPHCAQVAFPRRIHTAFQYALPPCYKPRCGVCQALGNRPEYPGSGSASALNWDWMGGAAKLRMHTGQRLTLFLTDGHTTPIPPEHVLEQNIAHPKLATLSTLLALQPGRHLPVPVTFHGKVVSCCPWNIVT